MFDFLVGSLLLAFDALFAKKINLKGFLNATILSIFISFLVGLIFKWWLGLAFVFITLLRKSVLV